MRGVGWCREEGFPKVVSVAQRLVQSFSWNNLYIFLLLQEFGVYFKKNSDRANYIELLRCDQPPQTSECYSSKGATETEAAKNPSTGLTNIY